MEFFTNDMNTKVKLWIGLMEYCCLVISHCTFSPFNNTSGIHVVHQINVIQSIYSLMVPDLPKVKC